MSDDPFKGLGQKVYLVLPPSVPKDVEIVGARLNLKSAGELRDTLPGAHIKKVFATKQSGEK